MSPARIGNTVQITVRVQPEFVERLDALAEKLSRPGLQLGRADVMRLAMEEGLKALEPADEKPASRKAAKEKTR